MTVKSLLIKFGVDVSEFNAGMDRMQANLEKHEKQFKAIGLGMAAVGGIMTAFFAKSIDEAAKAEAVQMKLEAALKRTGDTSGEGARMLGAYAKQLSLTTAYSDEEIMSAQALLTTYGLNASQIAELTPRVLDLASAHSNETGEVIGLESASKSLGMAVNGNATILQRQGVILAADTKATGDFALVCRDLDKSVGGTAITFGQTFAGQLKIARNQVGEVVETIGSKLLPLLLPLIQNITKTAQGIGTWIDAHQGLLKVLVPVLAGLGVLLTISGGILAILPKIIGGVVAVGKAFLFLAANPIVLVVAALAALGLALNSVINSMKAAQDATMNAMVADKSLAQAIEFRNSVLEKGIITQKELTGLCREYGITTKGLIEQAKRANELHITGNGILARLGQAYAEYEKNLKKTKETTAELSAKQSELQDKLSKDRKAMFDELVKLTAGELEMTKRAAKEAYEIRKKALDETKAANKEYNNDLILAGKIRDLTIKAAEIKIFEEKVKQRAEEMREAKEAAKTILEITRANDLKIFLSKAALAALMARLRGDELAAVKIELAAEYKAAEAAVLADATLSKAAKDEELKRLREFYAAKEVLAEDAKEKAIKIGLQIVDAMIGFLSQLSALSGARKQEQLSAIDEEYQARKKAIEDSLLSEDEKAKALQALDVEMAKRKNQVNIDAGRAQKRLAYAMAVMNIAQAITSALSAAPPPWNFVLAGLSAAAGAVQLGVIQATKFATGGVVYKPTLALIGEAGPEAVVPLRGAGRTGGLAFAGAGGGQQFRITNYFSGDIRSNKDIEEMSKAIADQIKRASKHRRF